MAKHDVWWFNLELLPPQHLRIGSGSEERRRLEENNISAKCPG